MKRSVWLMLTALLLAPPALIHAAEAPARKTSVSIVGEDFHINGRPTLAGRSWQGQRIEGLLRNVRMVQAIFDDLNPATAQRWAYADTGRWDAEHNVREFIAAMPEWRRHGLLAVTVNFQGGSPEGYSKTQPWETGAFTAALAAHASWGWFDYHRKGEGLNEGYQSPPVNWGLSSERKRAFFKLLAEITNGTQP